MFDEDRPITKVVYDYEPHPKQAQAHAIHVDELMYGGSAGGGKSRFGRAEAVLACMQVPGLAAIIFRRTFPDLNRSVVGPLLEEIPQELGYYHRSDHKWYFTNGSTLELGHLQSAKDLDKYQGAELQLIVFEEATHFTEHQFRYLKSRLRAAGKVKARMEELGIRPRMILTANPGGVGHHWVKNRFVDPAPPLTVFRAKPSKKQPNPPTRCYVPARVSDNPSVDDGYVDNLHSLPENLRKALLDGNWDVLDGVRFPSFSRDVHVIEPGMLPIPHFGYQRAVGIDYGSSAPFVALWGAKLSDDLVVIYREVDGKGLTPRQQAELIRDSEAPDERMPGRPLPLVLDPSMWARSINNPLAVASGDTPPPGSIASYYHEVFGSAVSKARNDRIGGWALVEEQLRVRDDGLPRLLIHSTCVNLIKTLPAVPRDRKNPDDVDTTSDDHWADAARYLLMELIGKAPVHSFDAQQWAKGRNVSTVTGDLGKARL
jgi:hypothetical protein